MDGRSFASPAEEVAYWKLLAEEVTADFEEYKETHGQVEEELENDLLTLEEKALDFELKFEQERQEKEDLIVRRSTSHTLSIT
jgi:hypothetical protein